MSDGLLPDVRFIAEFGPEGFVRAGISDFEGRPYLFVSEFLDWDAPSDEFVPEGFFLVRIPERDVGTVARLQKSLSRVSSDSECEGQATQAFAEWSAFRDHTIAEASVAVRAERNFLEVHLSEIGETAAPVADSGWVRRGEVGGEIMRKRLRWVETRWRELSGDSGEVGAGEDLPF